MNHLKSFATQVKNIWFLTGLAFFCLLSACASENPEVNKEDSKWIFSENIELTRAEENMLSGFNDFSHNLIKESHKFSDNTSFSVSPVSVSIYLAMLANATTGECRTEIMDALGVDDINVLNTLCRKLMQFLPCDANESRLAIGNRFWVADHNTVSGDFEGVMNRYFNADVKPVDFYVPSTVGDINKWVSDNTEGKIPGILDDAWQEYKTTEMIGANTVYFKGDWSDKFDKGKTEPCIFHSPAGDRLTPMMHQRLETCYVENEKVRSVRIAFEGYANDKYLFLPSEHADIEDILPYLSSVGMNSLWQNGEICKVTLSLPKFEQECDVKLPAILDNIGIRNLDNADLSPMGLGKLPLKMIHKTSVRIDEDGAELAAVTASISDGCNVAPEMREVSIDFDRPFFYLIKNTRTGAVLMAGEVVDF